MCDEYEHTERWMIEQKIAQKKKNAQIEIIMEVCINASACVMYKNEQEYCNRCNIRVESRNTRMWYAKKVGFLTRTHVKVASPQICIEEL